MIAAPGVRASLMREAIWQSMSSLDRLLYEADRVMRLARKALSWASQSHGLAG